MRGPLVSGIFKTPERTSCFGVSGAPGVEVRCGPRALLRLMRCRFPNVRVVTSLPPFLNFPSSITGDHYGIHHAS